MSAHEPGGSAPDVPEAAGLEPDPLSDVVVDARGTRCPEPVIRLAAAARRAPAGAVLELWATDPATRHDAPAWARMRGHALLDLTTSTGPSTGTATADVLVVRVRLSQPS